MTVTRLACLCEPARGQAGDRTRLTDPPPVPRFGQTRIQRPETRVRDCGSKENYPQITQMTQTTRSVAALVLTVRRAPLRRGLARTRTRRNRPLMNMDQRGCWRLNLSLDLSLCLSLSLYLYLRLHLDLAPNARLRLAKHLTLYVRKHRQTCPQPCRDLRRHVYQEAHPNLNLDLCPSLNLNLYVISTFNSVRQCTSHCSSGSAGKGIVNSIVNCVANCVVNRIVNCVASCMGHCTRYSTAKCSRHCT
jgi:hypothetical protein